jgi:hypothetical protein
MQKETSMLPLTLYFIAAFIIGSLSWALHLGPQSQALVLGLGMALFVIQKFVHRGPLRDIGFRRCTARQVVPAILAPVGILALVGAIDLVSGSARLLPITGMRNPFSGSLLGGPGERAGFLARNAA